MNEIDNKFILGGDKFMPEMYLRQLGFTYNAYGSFTKNKERIQKIMQTGDMCHIYRNDLDKACFQHDMAYGNYKNLVKRTESDKVLNDKTFKIASNLWSKVQNLMKYLEIKCLKVQVTHDMIVMKKD